MTDNFNELRFTLDKIKETQFAVENFEQDNHDPICGECGLNLSQVYCSAFILGCDNPKCWNFQSPRKALYNGVPFTTYVRI